MKRRSTLVSVLIIVLVALLAIFTINGALAKDNPPGCKNEVPGPDGFKNPNCMPEGPEFGNCNDGIDNDRDGLTDGDDPDCQEPPPPPACNDGEDNDGDDKTDFPDDPGCTSADDNDETDAPPAPACNDGEDNDGDDKTDFPADPGCTSADDNDETDAPPPPACSDGEDNDGDGKVDADDPGCENPEDNDETDPLQNCTAAAGDGGLLTDDTLAKTAWDMGLDALAPLTENPKRNGVITGPLGEAFQPPEGPLAALEVVGDEGTCLGDLLLDEEVSPIDP